MTPLQARTNWYVYELADPRDGKPFYVGKGCGKRIHHHEAEAKRGVCSKKTQKIKELWSDGLVVEKRQIAFFWEEQAAYDFETDRIEEIGLENLTNVLPGGQIAWRQRLQKRRASKPFCVVAWAKSVGDSVPRLLAEWLLAGMPRVSATGGKWFNRFATEACWNVLLPVVLKELRKSEEAMSIMMKRIKGLYGCP